MRQIFLYLCLVGPATAGSAEIRTPPARPAGLDGPISSAPASQLGYAPAPENQGLRAVFPPQGAAPPAHADNAVCAALLDSGTIRASRVAPIFNDKGCDVAAPVQVSAILLKDGSEAKLEPPAVMRCDMAAGLAEWVREDAAALAIQAGGRLVRVADAAAYDCRGRNRQATAKLSEHAFGNAVDVRALVLGDGRELNTKTLAAAPALRDRMRAGVCARFATVLGPGSDGYHEDHIHLDLAQRRHGAKLCRWN